MRGAEAWRREAERLAWWAWLVCPDAWLASRLADLRGPTPPWLGPTALLAIGLTTGLLAGTAVLFVFPSADHWRGDSLALVMVLHFAGVLLARGEDEGPEEFGKRFAAALLHAPYVLLAAMAWLGVWELFAGQFGVALRGGRDGLTPEFGLILIGLGVLALVNVVICGPQSFRRTQEGGVAEASFLFRLIAPLAYLLVLVLRQSLVVQSQMGNMTLLRALFGSFAILPEVKVGAVVAILAVLGVRPYELVCERLAAALFGGPPARSRGWPAWLAPLPLDLEAQLLCSPRTHDWTLAAELAFAAQTAPGRLVAIGRRVWHGGNATPEQTRLAALAAAVAWQSEVPAVSEAAWRLLEGILKSGHPALNSAFWAWLAGAARQRRADLVRWLLRERHTLRTPRAELLAILRPLRWTAVFDQVDDESRRELVGQVFELVAEVRSVALLEQVLRDLEGWREQQVEPDAVIAPALLVRWSRSILEAGQTPTEPLLAHAATLRRTALKAADGDEGAARTWYALARRFEDLPAARQRDILTPFGYRELWRMVLAQHPDEEETLRQEERYLRARQNRVVRLTTDDPDEPDEPGT